MKKLVLILIPAYNAAEFIADTIESVPAQTGPRKEIIVVNDGYQDDTSAIARQFESKKFSLWRKTTNGRQRLVTRDFPSVLETTSGESQLEQFVAVRAERL